jgi:hypothetical protein
MKIAIRRPAARYVKMWGDRESGPSGSRIGSRWGLLLRVVCSITNHMVVLVGCAVDDSVDVSHVAGKREPRYCAACGPGLHFVMTGLTRLV